VRGSGGDGGRGGRARGGSIDSDKLDETLKKIAEVRATAHAVCTICGQCTVHSISMQYTVNTMQYTVYTIQYSVYSIQCTIYSMQLASSCTIPCTSSCMGSTRNTCCTQYDTYDTNGLCVVPLGSCKRQLRPRRQPTAARTRRPRRAS